MKKLKLDIYYVLLQEAIKKLVVGIPSFMTEKKTTNLLEEIYQDVTSEENNT